MSESTETQEISLQHVRRTIACVAGCRLWVHTNEGGMLNEHNGDIPPELVLIVVDEP